MTELHASPLEKAVLDYFHQLYLRAGFPRPSSIRILSRENTGGGRYVRLECDQQVHLEEGYLDLGGKFIEMPGLPSGMMAVIFVEDRRLNSLEFTLYGGDFWDGSEHDWKIA